MEANAINFSLPSQTATMRRALDGGFNRVLEDTTRHRRSASASNQQDEHQVRELVQKLIAQTFFSPMLRQLRNSPWKSQTWSGGRGGEVFQGMMDQKLVEQISRSVGGPLVEAMTKQLLGKKYDRNPAARGLHAKNATDSAHVELDRRA